MDRRWLSHAGIVGAMLLVATLAAPWASATHPTNSCIDVTVGSPTQEADPIGIVQATLRSLNGSDCSGAILDPPNLIRIRYSIAGANLVHAEAACSLQPGIPSCNFGYEAGQVGTDTITVWIDHNNDGFIHDEGEPKDEATIEWLTKRDTIDCDDLDGRDTETQRAPGSSAASTETYSCLVTGSTAGSTPPPGTLMFAEVMTGVNDPDTNEANPSYSSQDYICEVNANGICELPITQVDNELGVTTICFWSGTQNPAGLCGDEPVNENQLGRIHDAGNDFADSVTLEWFPYFPDAELDCTPENTTLEPDDGLFVTCVTSKEVTSVLVEATGAKDVDSSDSPSSPDVRCTFIGGLVRTCSFFYDYDYGEGFGTTTYRAWIDADEDTATVEADFTEGLDAGTVPGSKPESDSTDVVQSIWLEPTATPTPTVTPTPDPQLCPGFENDTRNHIVGTTDSDSLSGTPEGDLFCLLGGDDVVEALGGNDTILGGGGADTLRGGGGADVIKGGSGDDTLFGQGGNDILRGGFGTDTCSGGTGVDDVDCET